MIVALRLTVLSPLTLKLRGRLVEFEGGIFMKHSRQNFFAVTIMAMLLALIIPATASAQGRGRGHGRGGIFGSSHNKCGKFVNCHDARDGRWDGRGPRGSRVGNIIWRNRSRNRNRGFFDDGIFRDRRFRNRDFDDDQDFGRHRRGWRRGH